jgi:glutathione S-transferase
MFDGASMRRLITIPISHYCEKARWGLDYCGLDYREEAHIQLFHWRHSKRAAGSKTVPVLVDGPDVFADSSDIVRHVAVQAGRDQDLYPDEHRAEIHRLEADFDAFGVETRKLFYAALRRPGGARFLRFNSHGAPWWEAAALRVAYPFALGFIARYLDVTEEAVVEAQEKISDVLDAVALRLRDGRRYLMGDTFTAADLSFASLAAPIAFPQEYGVPLPTRDEALAHAPDAGRYWEHPAVEFSLRMYAEHRR